MSTDVGTVVRGMQRNDSGCGVSVRVASGEEEFTLSYSASEPLSESSDFLLPGLLLSAMKHGGSLDLKHPVSSKLLSSAGQVQDILNMWESLFKYLEIRASEEVDFAPDGPRNPPGGVACAFGGGVDSFYTLMRHRDEITHLIYLHLDTDDPEVRASATRRVREIARETGKSLIEVDTNFRQLHREQHLPWKYGHGPWIASSVLLFQHILGKAYIPGSTTSNYDNLRPQGTHPMLDPLWSTELTEFHHEGCEVRRVAKAARISDYDVAMKWLQVCDLGGGGSNCGVCKKCLRTMVNLRAAGTLERCRTLPHEIELETVRTLDLSEYSESYFARENLRALEQSGRDPELASALSEAIEKGAAIIAHSGYKEENLQVQRSRVNNLLERNKRLQATNQRLRQRASQPDSLPVCQRYLVADRVADAVRRIPYSERVLRIAARLLLPGSKP